VVTATARRVGAPGIGLLVLALSAGACRGPAPGGHDGTSARPLEAPPPEAVPAAPSVRPQDDPPEAREARERLVREIAAERPWGAAPAWDARVLAALRAVPRHLFMPSAALRIAYSDHPQPIGHGQTISQPTIVAIMSDVLDLDGSEKVLEIGTGSGYQAAVLGVLAKQVYSIEIVAPLGEAARARLAELGYQNVHVRVGDGYKGWPEHAPFDRVLLTAAPPEIPDPLVEQLREGGVLVAPVGEQGDTQRLVRWTKREGRLHKEDLGAVRFVPMVPARPQ
jgi:protein-L-isoaspartate(D-aspartate) O-methyltransferase